jgi:Spy/CpxP family protein refolding chaperone
MIRSIAVGLLVAVATAGFGALSASAQAADPADEKARQARRPETRLWWNDPAVVEKLSLSNDQRAQMDQLYETYRNERKNASRSSNARVPFLEALEQGDMDQARKKLDSWAEGDRAHAQATGELKIGVIALLSEEQRKALETGYPRLIRQSWVPRASWERPPRPAGRKQQKKPTD